MELSAQHLALGLVWYLVFVLSVVLHEAAHAFAAMKLGDPTAYYGGQVTLNPLPHIEREPVGTIVVPTLSYLVGGWMIGWASAPYDPRWAAHYPRRAALMAAAGPAANLLLVLLALVAIRAGVHFDWFQAPMELQVGVTPVTEAAPNRSAPVPGVAVFLSILFTLNLLLFIFNLLPLPPLDGSAILQLFMRRETAIRYMTFMRQPGVGMFGLVVGWLVFGRLLPHIQVVSLNLLYPGAEYHLSLAV